MAKHAQTLNKPPKDSISYNERIFSAPGLRGFLHNARFRWARSVIERYGIAHDKVFEIGCYDGKILDWLPTKPGRYLGVDANWEGGVDLGRKRFADDSRVQFQEVMHPRQIDASERVFDLGISMETLEHVPPEMVGLYFDKLNQLVDGFVLITVPNEIGLLFGAKHLAKLVRYGDADRYSAREFVYEVLGRTDRVRRDQHKGFNYRTFLKETEAVFDIVAVDGIPFSRAPLSTSFGIGIVARTRAHRGVVR